MSCTHGHNERNCELCEKDADIARLTEAVKTLDEALNECIKDRDWHSEQLDKAEERCKRLQRVAKLASESYAAMGWGGLDDLYRVALQVCNAHNDLAEKEQTDG